jgi:uncharacterized RDD family membrane protein YckC
VTYELSAGERYAGFWIRFLAFIIDSVIVSLIIGPIAAALYERPDATGALIAAAQSGDLREVALLFLESVRPASIGEFLLNVVVPAAGVVAFWSYRSATPGKMATSTRIVDAESGGAPSTKQCVVRYLGYFVSIFGLFLGFLWVAFDRRKQGWHDKMARTVVIYTSQISKA